MPISTVEDETLTFVEASDFVAAMLRDQASSHLLEAIVACCPDRVFAVLWTTYFSGKLQKLAVHPVANFVVSRAIERVSADQLSKICEELEDAWNRLFREFYCRIIAPQLIAFQNPCESKFFKKSSNGQLNSDHVRVLLFRFGPALQQHLPLSTLN